MDAPTSVTCAKCGSPNHPDHRYCGICGTYLGLAPASGRPAAGDGKFALSTLLLVVTLAAVLFGVARIGSGLGILFLVIVIPGLAVSSVRLSRMAARGKEITLGTRLATIVASTATVFAIFVLLIIAGVAALFAFCAVLLGGFKF